MFRLILILLAVHLAFGASESHAFGKKPPLPPAGNPDLSFRPLTLHASPFGEGLADDHDGDCMSDEAEHVVASYFRPYWIFDSRENARRDSEPVGFYRVKTGLKSGQCGTVPATLQLRFAHLYKNDGGFATSLICRWSGHHGDNQTVDVTVRVSDEGRTFNIIAASIGDYTWPQTRAYFFDNHHPAVYLSAGKHHEYPDTMWNGWAYKYFYYGCREGVNGAGVRALAQLESPHAPYGWNNVGERDQHPAEHFVVDLTPFGFKGESAWGKTPFCGGYPGPCDPSKTSTMWDMWGE